LSTSINSMSSGIQSCLSSFFLTMGWIYIAFKYVNSRTIPMEFPYQLDSGYTIAWICNSTFKWHICMARVLDSPQKWIA
jgi:hypothetical protein